MADRLSLPANVASLVDAQFPGAAGPAYLDSSSTGLMPVRTVDAVTEFLADRRDKGKTADLWEQSIEGARSAFATLINADARDVAFTKNCTEGVNIVASGLPWRDGDNVVVCADLEHPANIYPWLNQQERGLRIKRVAPTGQAIDPDAMLAAIDDRTRIVAVSSVSFVPGFRTNLATLIKACRERDIFLLVDATQSAGVLETDVQALPVDGLVTSTHKYLMSVYGQGFLYCRPEWVERMRPMHLGKPGVDGSAEHPGLDGYTCRLFGNSRRFESGHLPIGSCALASSIGLILEIGPKAIESHATGLAGRLAAGFDELELPLNLDPFGEGASHIVTLGEIGSDEIYEVTDPVLRDLHDRLTDAGIRLSARRGLLRFSFHIYNNEADVDRLLEIVSDALPRSGMTARSSRP